MKSNVNVFIAVVLVAVLCGGVIWMQSADDEKLGWNIHDSYGEAPAYSGGAAYTNATFAGPSAGEGGVMTLSPSRSLGRGVSSSYAGAYAVSYSVSSAPLTSNLSPLTYGGAGGGQGLYTTSSQTFNSYGGGVNGGAAMPYSQSPIANGRSNSGLSNPSLQGGAGVGISPIAYSSARRSDMTIGAGENPAQMVAENPVMAMTNAASAGNGFYGFGSVVDYSGAANYGQYTGMFGGGRMGVRGRQGTTTFEDAWINWLLGWLQENGYTSADLNGNGIIDDDELARIYAALQEDSNSGMGVLPTEDDIRDFLIKSLPVGDIAPLLLIALLYVLFVAIKSNALKSLIKTERSE